MPALELFGAFLIAFGATFLGAISGGVGLVARPLFVFLGFSPLGVIATAPIAGLVGDIPVVTILARKKKVEIVHALLLAVPVFIGSLLASLAAVTILKDSIDAVLGAVLIAVALILFFSREFGLKERKTQFTTLRHAAAMAGTALIAALSTITGGYGVLYGMLYMLVYGKTYIGASALWRLAAYLGNLGAIFIFLLHGAVDWWLWIAITPGMLLGSYFGTHYGLRKGERWIRWIVIVVALGSGIKLLL